MKYHKTESDHLEMMRQPHRWPVWPMLPLQHRSRMAKDGTGFREMGFMFEGVNGEAEPKVYIGLMYFSTMGQKLEDLPVETYPDLAAVVAAGWEVN